MKSEYMFSLIDYTIEQENESSKTYAKKTIDEKNKVSIRKIYFSKINRMYFGMIETNGEKNPRILALNIQEHRCVHEQMKEMGWLK